MTCIVGLVDDAGVVWLGGDSASVTDSHDRVTVREPKVFVASRVAIGYAGSWRAGQLVRHKLEIPARDPEALELEGYMAGPFVDAVRETLGFGGALERAKSGSDLFPNMAALLVGIAGRLFLLDSDFGFVEPRDGFSAIGCGDVYALGSLDSTRDRPPRDRILAALKSAAHFSAGVAPPFSVVNTAAPSTRRNGATSDPETGRTRRYGRTRTSA